MARAMAGGSRSDARLTAQIRDLFLADEDRLDDRTRAAAAASLRAVLLVAARDLAARVADQMPGHFVDRHGDALSPDGAAAAVLHRLYASGLVQDQGVMEELFARVRQDILSDALRANQAPGVDASFLPALAASSNAALADAARAYGIAENRRRADGRTDLPAAHRETVMWWAAAALREHWGGGQSAVDAAEQAARDRAIADAAQRHVAAYDDQDRLEVVALRLAAALGPAPSDLAEPLIAALEEGCLALFIALLVQALALDPGEVRALVLDPRGERLWLALRAVDLDRAAIARIGFLLADADPRRDLEAFAGLLDAIAAIPAQEAVQGLAVLALPPPFRAAMRALDRAVAR